MTARVLPGSPHPLGATFDGAGVNFAVFSAHATGVDVCLFDRATGARERDVLTLREQTGHVFHGYVRGLEPGQIYGLRVHGPWDPQGGMRFNSAKLVLDPYARAVANEIDWHAPMFPFMRDDPRGDLAIDVRDNAHGAPKALVVDGAFDWGDDRPLDTPWNETVIYEAHVKGLTARHPDVPEDLRGTYAGLASPPVIRHLKELGVTAIELLPVHEIGDEPELRARGLSNYWGYSTLGYFAPARRYARARDAGGQVAEWKAMVKALHAAGIEVLLDVVYNHTAEGGARGPQLSLRGIDNATYYRLDPTDRRLYEDFTGTGNSLDLRQPQVLKLVLDSLRYWATEMHVDGFRFDLAVTLARDPQHFERGAAFLDAIHQDPVLSRRKLIAEPWDIGGGGYQVGNFPAGWAEWNGRYRDGVRRFWRGDGGAASEIGYRLTGSSDLYEGAGRAPQSSVNFITAHDGFTLRDLVSYERKHNEANGEDNRDGSDANDADNHGVEGETDDPAIIAARDRQVRNFLATLAVSQGVPMITAGDEMGRTQRGNNNAYCQDSDISWVDWSLDARQRELLAFARRLFAIRRAEPVLRRSRFFSGGYVRGSELRDIVWQTPEGREMTAEDWGRPGASALQMRLGGDAIGARDADGEPVTGATLLVLVNGGREPVEFHYDAATWELVIDTGSGSPPRAGSASYVLAGRSMAVMRQSE